MSSLDEYYEEHGSDYDELDYEYEEYLQDKRDLENLWWSQRL